jgi:hypothetical protein
MVSPGPIIAELAVAVGTAITGAPRTDPYVKNYFTRLFARGPVSLPQILRTSVRHTSVDQTVARNG